MIDPAWEGKVQFYELVYGTWLTYAFLVILWEKLLGARLEEWRYALITFIGASFFLVNHYFQFAPFYSLLLNGYTLCALVIWYFICVHPQQFSIVRKIVATLAFIVFTIAFILFENIARYAVDNLGYHEFWMMLGAYFGFIWLIVWRGRQPAVQIATN